jgi:DNA invertase Pin-like site-specific DNA recombinase
LLALRVRDVSASRGVKVTPASNTPAVLYLRVSSQAQGESGLGLEAQEAACRRECERRGWDVVDVITEVESTRKARPLKAAAMDRARELHGVLVVSDDDRISRSTVETLTVHDRAQKEGWHFFACNMPNVDTTSPEGRFMATVFAAFAELERAKIGRRTSRALRAKIARGEPVGQPRTLDPLAARMAAMRGKKKGKGMTYQQIADALNGEGLRTRYGGPFTRERVYQTVKSYGNNGRGS